MTQRIKVAGPGFDYATLSAALASITPSVPFTQPIVIEVYATAPSEVITVPSNLLPTPANPLIIMSLRAPTVTSLFPNYQLDSGSMAQYPPPQPRLVQAQMDFFDIQANNVFLDGFQVNGDLQITSNTGVTVNGCLVIGGQLRVVRVAPTSATILISNCQVELTSAQSAVRIVNAGGVQFYNNTILIRTADALSILVPSYAVEAEASAIDARNNVIAAAGPTAFAIRFGATPGTSNFQNNVYFAFDGGAIFNFDNGAGGPVTVTSNLTTWSSFMTSETGSATVDPEFRDRLNLTTPNLDVAVTSATLALAPFLPSVTHDLRGQRRPVDFVTVGAYEHAEVITDAGRVRFLQILSGLSVQPVNMAVLGSSGSGGLLQDFTSQTGGPQSINELFTPIPMSGAVAPGNPGQEGMVVFLAAFQVTEPIYGQLAGSSFDYADEVGLVTPDNVLFMVKRMHKIPFDDVGFMTTQFQIPLEIVG